MDSAHEQFTQQVMDLLAHLPADALEANWSDAELTRQLVQRLGAAGREAGWRVGSSLWAKANDPAWPADLAEGQLKAVRLALGVEWSLEEAAIVAHFQRLLVNRASLRVMVLQQKTKEAAAAHLEALVKQIEGFGQSCLGDRYLLACSDFKSAAFTYRKYVCP